MLKLLSIVLFATFITGCFDPANNNVDEFLEPTVKATGDSLAIELAQRVIDESGGQTSWDAVPYISFDYFGRRYWFWDKKNNRYRVEVEKRNLSLAGKLDGTETHLSLNGQITTDGDSIAKYKDYAHKVWINDTYWLIFPFKMLDPGVHLKYLGSCNADSLTQATCIELTFGNVGVTPENKYTAYIDTMKYEVIRWDFYENKNDTLPEFNNTWTGYKKYGAVKISGGRGDDSIRQIAIHEKLPDELFKDVSKSYKELWK